MMARFAVTLAVCVATLARGENWQDIAAAFFSDDDCQAGSTDESCALNALQLARCTGDFETEVRAPLMEMVKQLKDITNQLVVSLNEADETSKEDNNMGLLPLTTAANKILRKVGPTFLLMLNNTNAAKRDPGLEQYGEHAVMQQDSMLTMLKFTVVHSGLVMQQVIDSTDETSNDFAVEVNEDAQAAREWLKSSLLASWLSAKDMLPRVQALVNGSYSSPEVMAKQAACASDTATGISKLTTLYSDIVTAGSDCNVSNAELYSKEDCQSSALNVQSGIDGVIKDGASMMWNCYKSSWVCAKSVATTSSFLIKAFMSTIVMKGACDDTDTISLAVCKSESFQLLAGLSAAATNMFETANNCQSNCR